MKRGLIDLDAAATDRRQRRRADDSTIWQAATANVTPLTTPTLAVPRPSQRRAVRPHHTPLLLDLHGLSVADAHQRTLEFLSGTDSRRVMIVTGRSGAIRREFCAWLTDDSRVRDIEEMHGGGAFRIHRK